MNQCVQFDVVNADLVITLLPEGKEKIKEAIEDSNLNISSDDFLHDLFEHQTCNGWEWIEAYEINALTSAPILSCEGERDDDGELVKIGRIYWFPNYAVESLVQTLYDTGVVKFAGLD